MHGHSGSSFFHRKLRLFKTFTQIFATVSLKGSRYAHVNGIKRVQEFRECSEKLTVSRYEEQVGAGYVIAMGVVRFGVLKQLTLLV